MNIPIKNSTRVFDVVYFEGAESSYSNYSIPLFELALNTGELADTELLYTLQEELDDILDLQIDETRFFTFRDNKNNKGILKRIS